MYLFIYIPFCLAYDPFLFTPFQRFLVNYCILHCATESISIFNIILPILMSIHCPFCIAFIQYSVHKPNMYLDLPVAPSSSSFLTFVLSRVNSLFPPSFVVLFDLHIAAKWPLLPHLLLVFDFAGHLSSLYECPLHQQRKHLSFFSVLLVGLLALLAPSRVAATVCLSIYNICLQLDRLNCSRNFHDVI